MKSTKPRLWSAIEFSEFIRGRAVLFGELWLHKSRPRKHAHTHTPPHPRARAHMETAVEEGEHVFACKDWCTNTTRPRGFRKEQQVWHPLPSTFYLPAPLPSRPSQWHSSGSTYLPSRDDLSSPTQVHPSTRCRRENNTRVARAWGDSGPKSQKPSCTGWCAQRFMSRNNCAKLMEIWLKFTTRFSIWRTCFNDF